MKIVQLCPYDMARPGGVQRHVSDLCDWLDAQGHETRIVAPPAVGGFPWVEGRLIRIGRARSLSVHGTAFELSHAGRAQIRRTVRELHDWGADVVHLHTPWTPLLVWQVWRALRLPTVTTIHATLPTDDGTGLVDRYIRRAARHFMARSQAVVVPSTAPLPFLNRLVPDLPVDVLPPAVDLSQWNPAQQGDAKVQALFMGRLEARKGVNIMLAAWQDLGPRLKNLHLTIAGDGDLRPKVEAALRSDRTGRLRYVGRPDDTVARALMGQADLFLAPAPYGESFGIVLVEAMSSGAVPIAAGNTGYSSVLTGKGSALLCKPNEPNDLMRKIETLTRDTSQRHTMRDWALEQARRFDVAHVGPEFLRLYQQVTGPVRMR